MIMEIRFNPLIADEAAAVLRMLAPTQASGAPVVINISREDRIRQLRDEAAAHLAEDVIDPADRPDIGVNTSGLDPAGGVPLPPPPAAPLPAAADLFSTAPAVQPAGAASATPVPPPPVPSAHAPDVPPAPAAAASPAPAGDLDKNGLPWDARIHSGTKAVNADGSWRQRRGLNDPALVTRVEAELRALLSAAPLPSSGPAQSATPPAPASVVPAPPVPAPDTSGSTPVAPPAAPVPSPPASVASTVTPNGDVPNVPASPTSAPATAPIPSPPAAAPAAPGESDAPITFAQLMTKITSNVTTGKLTEAQVQGHLKSLGFASVGQVAGDAVQRKALAELLDADLAAS